MVLKSLTIIGTAAMLQMESARMASVGASNIQPELRSDGHLVLIEYRAEDPSVPIKPLHRMSVKPARRGMAVVGLAL